MINFDTLVSGGKEKLPDIRVPKALLFGLLSASAFILLWTIIGFLIPLPKHDLVDGVDLREIVLPIKLPDIAAARSPYAELSAESLARRDKIMIVIADLGPSGRILRDVIERFPADTVTLSLLPYMERKQDVLISLQEKGFEYWLQIPSESETTPVQDMGPLGLELTQGAFGIEDRLGRLMFNFPEARGVVFAPDAAFPSRDQSWERILEKTTMEGKSVLDTTSFPTKNELLRFDSLIKSHVLLDEIPNETQILSKIDELTAKARDNGFAIGVIRPYPVSLDTLQMWFDNQFESDTSPYQLMTLGEFFSPLKAITTRSLDRGLDISQ